MAACRDGQRRRLPPSNAGHCSRGRGEVVIQVVVVDRGGGRGGAGVSVVVVCLSLGVVMKYVGV